jgi:hypothetical protein
MNIRRSGTTAANSNSSRSHVVLQIILKTSSPNSVPSSVSSSRNNNHNNPTVPRRLMKEVGKMSLIDLAEEKDGKLMYASSRSICYYQECAKIIFHNDQHFLLVNNRIVHSQVKV